MTSLLLDEKKEKDPFDQPPQMNEPYDWTLKTGWTMEDQANAEFLRFRYQNREALGKEWHDKRKFADEHRKLESGKDNPMHPRYAMEEQIARLQYDMAYVLEENRILREKMQLFSSLFDEVAILRGAYMSVKATSDHVKDQWQGHLLNLLKEIVSLKQPVNSVEPINKKEDK